MQEFGKNFTLLSNLIGRSANKKNIHYFYFVLCIAISHQTANLTLQSLNNITINKKNGRTTQPSTIEKKDKMILTTELFGRIENIADKINSPELIQRTQLNTNVLGILSSNTPSRSIAIIARNNQQQSYVIGDVIQGIDARITNILPDRVIISRQGQEEILLLDDESTTASSNSVAVERSGVEQNIDINFEQP